MKKFKFAHSILSRELCKEIGEALKEDKVLLHILDVYPRDLYISSGGIVIKNQECFKELIEEDMFVTFLNCDEHDRNIYEIKLDLIPKSFKIVDIELDDIDDSIDITFLIQKHGY